MSQYRTHRLYRYTIGEANLRSHRMSAHVPGEMLGDAASFRHTQKNAPAIGIAWNRKYSPVRTQSPVLLHDGLGVVQQLDG